MIIDEKTLTAVAEFLNLMSGKIMTALKSDNPEAVLMQLSELVTTE